MSFAEKSAAKNADYPPILPILLFFSFDGR